MEAVKASLKLSIIKSKILFMLLVLTSLPNKTEYHIHTFWVTVCTPQMKRKSTSHFQKFTYLWICKFSTLDSLHFAISKLMI